MVVVLGLLLVEVLSPWVLVVPLSGVLGVLLSGTLISGVLLFGVLLLGVLLSGVLLLGVPMSGVSGELLSALEDVPEKQRCDLQRE